MAQRPDPSAGSPQQRPAPGAPLPRWAVVLTPVAVGAAALAGLLLPGRWPALLLLAVLAGLAWLTSRTWPFLDRGGRLMRMVVLGGLSALVIARLLG